MLRNVLILSGVVITAAVYPLLSGMELRQDSFLPKPSTASPVAATEQPMIVARAETPVLGNVVRIAKDSRGHYSGEFKLNGRRVNAMIDTGATAIAINQTMARNAGVTLQPSDFTGKVTTANGMAKVAYVTLDNVEIGRIRVNKIEAVVIQDTGLPVALIGMNFLNRLEKFEVRSGVLVLSQ